MAPTAAALLLWDTPESYIHTCIHTAVCSACSTLTHRQPSVLGNTLERVIDEPFFFFNIALYLGISFAIRQRITLRAEQQRSRHGLLAGCTLRVLTAVLVE